jgi:hypothetical protein
LVYFTISKKNPKVVLRIKRLNVITGQINNFIGMRFEEPGLVYPVDSLGILAFVNSSLLSKEIYVRIYNQRDRRLLCEMKVKSEDPSTQVYRRLKGVVLYKDKDFLVVNGGVNRGCPIVLKLRKRDCNFDMTFYNIQSILKYREGELKIRKGYYAKKDGLSYYRDANLVTPCGDMKRRDAQGEIYMVDQSVGQMRKYRVINHSRKKVLMKLFSENAVKDNIGGYEYWKDQKRVNFVTSFEKKFCSKGEETDEYYCVRFEQRNMEEMEIEPCGHFLLEIPIKFNEVLKRDKIRCSARVVQKVDDEWFYFFSKYGLEFEGDLETLSEEEKQRYEDIKTYRENEEERKGAYLKTIYMHKVNKITKEITEFGIDVTLLNLTIFEFEAIRLENLIISESGHVIAKLKNHLLIINQETEKLEEIPIFTDCPIHYEIDSNEDLHLYFVTTNEKTEFSDIQYYKFLKKSKKILKEKFNTVDFLTFGKFYIANDYLIQPVFRVDSDQILSLSVQQISEKSEKVEFPLYQIFENMNEITHNLVGMFAPQMKQSRPGMVEFFLGSENFSAKLIFSIEENKFFVKKIMDPFFDFNFLADFDDTILVRMAQGQFLNLANLEIQNFGFKAIFEKFRNFSEKSEEELATLDVLEVMSGLMSLGYCYQGFTEKCLGLSELVCKLGNEAFFEVLAVGYPLEPLNKNQKVSIFENVANLEEKERRMVNWLVASNKLASI